jgi:hypothetical protein
MRCTKHDEETAVSCGRCSTPVCPKCMVHTDVGVRCKTCAPDIGKRRANRGASTLVVAGVVLLAIVGIGTIGSGVLGDSTNSSVDYYDEYYDEYVDGLIGDVTTVTVLDPWIPATAGDVQPPEGRRFIAIEFTISAPDDSVAPAYASPAMFKLVDDEGFVYPPLDSGKQPQLKAVSLENGEKTRGWVTFEVNEDAVVDTLHFFNTDVPLGDQPASSG